MSDKIKKSVFYSSPGFESFWVRQMFEPPSSEVVIIKSAATGKSESIKPEGRSSAKMAASRRSAPDGAADPTGSPR